MKETITRTVDTAICFVSKTWRPVTCVGIAGGAIVNLILIPLVNWEVPDLTAAAAYIAAATAAFGVRAFEKFKGFARGHDING